ncbi:MAG: hypothetical protein ACJATE_000329 [Bacteroidia bacterium]|jgi:hypothetical protein
MLNSNVFRRVFLPCHIKTSKEVRCSKLSSCSFYHLVSICIPLELLRGEFDESVRKSMRYFFVSNV